MFYIYLLKCNNNKYYVGRTSKNVDARYQEHQIGIGSNWTSRYRPISIMWVKSTNNDNLELAKTLECMKKYGIHNVRGGPHCWMVFRESNVRRIYDQLRSICFRCGNPGHFAANCDNCYQCGKSGHDTADCCFRCGWPGHEPRDCNNCFICGRWGHYAIDCYYR